MRSTKTAKFNRFYCISSEMLVDIKDAIKNICCYFPVLCHFAIWKFRTFADDQLLNFVYIQFCKHWHSLMINFEKFCWHKCGWPILKNFADIKFRDKSKKPQNRESFYISSMQRRMKVPVNQRRWNFFAKIVIGFTSLSTIFTKCSTRDFWEGPKK